MPNSNRLLGLAAFLASLSIGAQNITVPNSSFEQVIPPEAPAWPFFEEWQKFPKPADWNEAVYGPFDDNSTGVFPNPPAGQFGHIENLAGNQAAYIFSVAGYGFFQKLTASYQPNSIYTLTAALVGSAYRPLPAEGTLAISLFYSTPEGGKVAIATRVVKGSELASATHTTDFSIASPTVPSGSPWVGQPIGVSFISTASLEAAGGVWDIEDIRMRADPALSLRIALEGQNVRLSWDSAAGVSYSVRRTEDFSSWTSPTPLPGTGGELSILVPISDPSRSYFVLQATPIP